MGRHGTRSDLHLFGNFFLRRAVCNQDKDFFFPFGDVQLSDRALSSHEVVQLYGVDHMDAVDWGLVTSNGTLTARIFGIAGEDYVEEGTTNMVDLSARESILYIGDVGNAPVTVTMQPRIVLVIFECAG